jgi:uncharacterized protein (TIGR00251 family)
MASYLKLTDQGVVLDVVVQPRSSRSRVVGVHDGALKLQLTAPPVGGAANKMCIATLAKLLRLPKGRLEIVGGETSRKKRVLVRFDSASATTAGLKAAEAAIADAMAKK